MINSVKVFSLAVMALCLLSGCNGSEGDDVVFNEMVSSVLRGVLIKGPISDHLGVTPGYYRIREFRVGGQPKNKAIVFCIHKPYATYIDPALSVLPLESEEFVFSKISDWSYNLVGRQATVEDQHGHLFKFEITWGSPCHQIQAELDGIPVHMSTQSYVALTLNSCGWEPENEDAFTVPGQQ